MIKRSPLVGPSKANLVRFSLPDRSKTGRPLFNPPRHNTLVDQQQAVVIGKPFVQIAFYSVMMP
jgi:hypothetical protein